MASVWISGDTAAMDTSSRSNASDLVRTTGCFFVVSSIYGVLAFRNFPALVVIGLQLVVLSFPVLVMLRARRFKVAGYERPTLAAVTFSAAVALFFVGLQLDALVGWDALFTNFAFERLEAGGGYHRDSVFHIAIIQNILNHGVPSTGQHETPFIAYHFLSYYFDAALIGMFALDAWESYALLFFAKTSVVLISLLYFLTATIPAGGPRARGLVLVFGALSFVASWAVVGGHTNWVPIVALLLSGPWLHRVLWSDRIQPLQLAALSGLVVFLTLGKSSIGLAFAAVVAVLLLFRQRMSLAASAVAALWAGWLLTWSTIVASYSGASSRVADIRSVGDVIYRVLNHGLESGAIMTSLLLLAGGLIYLGRHTSTEIPLHAGISVLLAFLAIAVLAAAVATGSDGSYYMMALFHVGFVVGVPALFGSECQVSQSREGQLVLLLTFALVLAPVTYQSYGDPVGNLRTIMSGSTVTYDWYNLSVPSDRRASVRRFAQGSVGHGVAEREPTSLEVARNEILRTIAEHDLNRSDVFLFVPKETFDQLEHELGIAATSSWNPSSYNGLLVTAVTGLPLIYGIPAATHWRYGFGDYATSPQSVRQRSSVDTPLEALCGHGRAVIVLSDVALPSVAVECLGS